MTRTIAAAACCLFLASSAGAAPVVETIDRMEINWGQLRVRYYGEAAVGADNREDALKNAEKRARADGIGYIREAAGKLNDGAGEDAVKEAAKALANGATSYNTTYFADGTVRVHLESQLGHAVPAGWVRFRQKESASHGPLAHTGVVLKVDKAIKPVAQYKVVDESGATLFEVKEMAESAYRRHLMGRWFKRPSPAELGDSVGKNPVTLEAEVLGPEVLRVSRAAWIAALDGNQPLLVNGTIALALP